ncbi:MAG: hypothetical protein I3273_06190 [Candidatus Moeniiplasma glomeromycotorum]|nr:hypothetical protein [Candidatus Moeniiplasma glomeromycotorum]MCE8168006.1 hypothetical protein [Candidatus Moeniiplasma glomeromycotorum]MCE8169674.1 hypothetical protein [Candidatus Moeniiplasma glomeromycotorum]
MKYLPTNPFRFKVEECKRLAEHLTSKERIKNVLEIAFLPEIPPNNEIEGIKGIYLPLELAGDIQTKPVPSPNKWLTDDNIAFILKHKDFITSTEAEKRKETDEGILWGYEFCIRTDLANIYFAKEIAKWITEKREIDKTRKDNLDHFKETFEKGETKFTIFPINLGEHPGNHWGMLVFIKEVGGEKGRKYGAFYTSSLYNLESEVREIKPLVAYLAGENVAKNLKTFNGAKQTNGEDCGVFLCLYIKEIIEYKARKSTKPEHPLKLKANYTTGEIEKFRQEWKEKVGEENWCRKDKLIKETKDSKYGELLEEAKNNGWEAEISGIWEREESDPFDFWLIATQPYNIRIFPPKKEKKIIRGTGGTIDLITHICPWNELPKVEENFQKRFGQRINELEESERNLVDARKDLNNQLNKERFNIRDICKYWDTDNLVELKNKMKEEKARQKRYWMERNQAQAELKEEKKERETWESAAKYLIAKMGGIKNKDELEKVTEGKTLLQIKKERDLKSEELRKWLDTTERICKEQGADSLKGLVKKINKAIIDLTREKKWFKRWLYESKELNIRLDKDYGDSYFYSVNLKKKAENTKFYSIVAEIPVASKNRQIFQAIHDYYVKSFETDPKILGLTELDKKVGKLVGTDYKIEQIAQLQDLFITNDLPQVFEFIQEITSLTNNYRIRELENWANNNKENLNVDDSEKLKNKIEGLEPLLLAANLPETYRFLENGFKEWISLLELLGEVKK